MQERKEREQAGEDDPGHDWQFSVVRCRMNSPRFGEAIGV